MTDLQIGRLGTDADVDQPGSGSWSGQAISIDAFLHADTLDSLLAQREQLIAYDGSPDPIPVIAVPDSRLTGFYLVSSVSVDVPTGAFANFVLPFSCTLSRVSSSAAPLIESRVIAATRQKTLGGTNAPGVSPQTSWHAVPGTAQGYRAPSPSSVVTRQSASGTVRVYLAGFNDATPSWQQSPSSFFDGASTLKVGSAGDLPGVEITEFEFTGAAQSYTVPTGVGRLLVSVKGASGGRNPYANGGKGAVVSAVVDVSPADVWTVDVGGTPTGKTGGFLGGGDGGDAGGAGSSEGSGGGGLSRVYKGAVSVIAGGGGGAGVDQSNGVGGGDAGYNGSFGFGPAGGDGGTQTAAGSYGGPLAGGNGAPGGGLDTWSSGGGGSGFFGGGGGRPGPTGSGGGGGSSHADSSATSVTYGARTDSGDGSVMITAIPGTGGVYPPAQIARYTVVGRQCPAEPLGWQIDNGLVRVRPSYDGTTATLEVAGFDGAAWRPKSWLLWDKVAGAALRARPRAISVLRNAPEEVRLRWICDLPDDLNTVTVDLRVRRGARMVEITTQSTASTAKLGWLLGTAEAGATVTGGVYAAVNDSNGGRYVITSPDVWTADTTTGGLALTAAGTAITVGVGYVGAYASAITEDKPPALIAQFFAAGTETMAVVSQ